MKFKVILGLSSLVWGFMCLFAAGAGMLSLMFSATSVGSPTLKSTSVLLAFSPALILLSTIVAAWIYFFLPTRRFRTFLLINSFPILLVMLVGIINNTISTDCFGLACKSKFFKSVGSLKYNYAERQVSPVTSLATELQDGQVAMFGGSNIDPSAAIGSAMEGGRPNRRKAEAFDVRTWKRLQLPDAPYDIADDAGLCATRLESGHILITGDDIGRIRVGGSFDCPSNASEEERRACRNTTSLLYLPETHCYRRLTGLRPIRSKCTFTALPDGKVLILGGSPSSKEFDLRSGAGYPAPPCSKDAVTKYVNWLKEQQRLVQIYDPEKDAIRTVCKIPGHEMLKAHATIMVAPDKFLVIGGDNYSMPLHYFKDILLFDLSAKAFRTVGEMNFPRSSASVVKLRNGHYLVVGGNNANRSVVAVKQAVSELEEFDLTTGQCRLVGRFESKGAVRPACLPDGRVLLISGSSVGLFDPSVRLVDRIDQLRVPRSDFSVIKAPNGNIFVLGGIQKNHQQEIEMFDFEKFQKDERKSSEKVSR